MTELEKEMHKALEAKIDKLFTKRIRLVAENSKGLFSSRWMFWGNRNDFYFGSKNLLNTFKVSLHANGKGYLAYDKLYLRDKLADGFNIPGRTAVEWAMPVPSSSGAVHVASLFLPANYCNSPPLDAAEKKKTLVFGLEDDCAAEIGLFYSMESQSVLEPKLVTVGSPIVMVTLENGLTVSIVARSVPFDPAVLPSDEMVRQSQPLLLQRREEILDNDNLNAMLYNKPADGETLQVLDVGGVRWMNHKA